MKLGDLKRLLRGEEQLDAPELAAPTFPGTPVKYDINVSMKPIKGRDGAFVVIDDPIKEAPWMPLAGPAGPIDHTKPDSIETMLRRGRFSSSAIGERFEGTIVYDSERDELCMVKGIDNPLTAEIKVWFGARRPDGIEVIVTQAARFLFKVETYRCGACTGRYSGEGRRGFDGAACMRCCGLRVVPTATGLKPWAAEKAARAERRAPR
jgi:hypothetical protein